MFGYVYTLTDGVPVVVICKDEYEVERSLSLRTFDNDEDLGAFWVSLSYIRPVQWWAPAVSLVKSYV